MRKLIVLVLIGLMVFGSAGIGCAETNSDVGSYDKGYLNGEEKAKQKHDSTGWLMGGMGSGFFSGLIGYGIVYSAGWSIGGPEGGFLSGLIGTSIACGVNAISTPDVPKRNMLNKADSYKMGYRDGYTKIAREKNLTLTLVGGLVGTVLAVAVIAAVWY